MEMKRDLRFHLVGFKLWGQCGVQAATFARVSRRPVVMTFTNMLGLVIRTVACTSEMCGGQPPMCPVRTPGLATSRPESESHRQVHSLHFTNAAAEPARLEWIASNGSIGAVLVTLAPGQTRGVSARTGDVFTASGSNSG